MGDIPFCCIVKGVKSTTHGRRKIHLKRPPRLSIPIVIKYMSNLKVILIVSLPINVPMSPRLCINRIFDSSQRLMINRTIDHLGKNYPERHQQIYQCVKTKNVTSN